MNKVFSFFLPKLKWDSFHVDAAHALSPVHYVAGLAGQFNVFFSILNDYSPIFLFFFVV